LLAFLKKQYTVEHPERGIYRVKGDTSPTQVLVSEELSEEENLWLNSLRNDLPAAQLERAAKSKDRRLPMDAFFQVIGEANIKAMEELHMRKKNGVILSETLDAYFREKYSATYIAEGEANGEIRKGREAVVTVLRTRFKKVPKEVEKVIRQMVDLVALESWLVQAAACQSMDEFAQALR
jgi:hypothetical protein